MRSFCRLGVGDEHRLVTILTRKELFQGRDLRQIVDRDVGLRGVQRQVILMIGLGRVENLVRFDFGDDGAGEDVSLVELGDIGLRDAGLFAGLREDRRAVLRPDIRPLAVEFGRVSRRQTRS
jgi:hypothetical protein